MTNQPAYPGPRITAKKTYTEPRRRAVAPQRAKPGPRIEPTKMAAHSSKDGGSARRGSKTAKVLDLLSDRRRWSQLRAAARSFVETERNWTSSVARYRQPYYRLTGEAGAAYGRA